jgi:hypothetical protein
MKRQLPPLCPRSLDVAATTLTRTATTTATATTALTTTASAQSVAAAPQTGNKQSYKNLAAD